MDTSKPPLSLDEKFSTTRILTKEKPVIKNNPDDKSETVLFLPKVEGRKAEGGLRIRGYFKKSLPDKPLITVVTVVFNGEEHLDQAILSVLNQSYDNVEYIIIDGGSTDKTIEIIKKYENAIDYWVSEPDKGIYDAMNKGVFCTKGEYILHLNSDDFLEDNVLVKIVKEIEKNQGFDVYHGSFLIHTDEKNSIKKVGHGFLPTSIPAYQPATFVRLSAINKREWFDAKYKIAADFKFFKELQLQGLKFLRLDLLITHFAVGGASSDNKLRMSELKAILIELNYPKITVNLLIYRIQIVEYFLSLKTRLY
jgi:glycosyltransferase involved in cell wall biosynthesis